MGFMSLIWGVGGKASNFFGGVWMLVGFFIIISIVLMLLAKRVSAPSILFFFFAALLMATIDDLFHISKDIYILIIVLATIFFSIFLYKIINR